MSMHNEEILNIDLPEGARIRQVPSASPRERSYPLLFGDVLEIGPGHRPYPTAEGARVKYADRHVGARDELWPELAGCLRGPDADYDVNLSDGMPSVPTEFFDSVIASHVLDHVINPLRALEEIVRVTKLTGRIVVNLPDRHHTFDRWRGPARFQHLLNHYRNADSAIDASHIREQCESMWRDPSVHPPAVRLWHDPATLTPSRVSLHQKRTVHAHAWAPEEFAVIMASAIDHFSWPLKLVDAFTVDDIADGPSRNEFSLVFCKLPPVFVSASSVGGAAMLRDWLQIIQSSTHSDEGRASSLIGEIAIARGNCNPFLSWGTPTSKS